MAKPEWRAYDEQPRRVDDIKVSFMGLTLEASGRMVVFVIMAVVAGTAFFVHDWRTAQAHDVLADNFAVMTCVLTLSEPQRAEFREHGRYCGDDSAYYRMRRQVRPEGTLK